MKTLYSYLLFFSVCFMACTSEGEEPTIKEPEIEQEANVSFRGYINQSSRATETTFEKNDAISVFAVDPAVGTELKAAGNYANNVKYVYQGSRFGAATGSAITISDKQAQGLAYYAVYPYWAEASNKFLFHVRTDQSSHTDYTSSDLCVSYCPPTTNTMVNLEFNHRLSNIVVKFYGNNLTSKNLNVKLANVYSKCNVDINANTYQATGSKGTIVMGEESGNTYRAIIVPQTVKKDAVFMIVSLNGQDIELSLNSDMAFKSGKQTIFEYEVKDDEIVELNGYINPWNTEDPRLESVVPEEILNKLDDHMPIYTGANPPNVEGTYYADPFETVHCEDNGYEPGKIISSQVIRFSNQNNGNNTVDYERYDSSGSDMEKGTGAFISGSGSDFTAFFNTEGVSSGISYKTALVISGTKTNSGIKNLYYSFVMVEKGPDPNNKLMKEGFFRVFKDQDGLSVPTSWNPSSRSVSIDTESFSVAGNIN